METTDKHIYQPDDYVSYAGSGVCRVIGQETQSPDGIQEIQYYKLQPLDSKNSTYYVPVEHAEVRLRPLLTKEEIYHLIDEIPAESEEAWCTNSRERRNQFHTVLGGDDNREIIRMMRTLHQEQERKKHTGHKLSSADESAMYAAENRVYQEFGLVLGIRPEKVHDFILKHLEASNK